MKKITFLFALILSAGSAFAQPGVPAARTLRGGVEQPVDARFSGWLGCWRLDDDRYGGGPCGEALVQQRLAPRFRRRAVCIEMAYPFVVA